MMRLVMYKVSLPKVDEFVKSQEIPLPCRRSRLRGWEGTKGISAKLFLSRRDGEKMNIEHRTSNVQRRMGKDEETDIVVACSVWGICFFIRCWTFIYDRIAFAIKIENFNLYRQMVKIALDDVLDILHNRMLFL